MKFCLEHMAQPQCYGLRDRDAISAAQRKSDLERIPDREQRNRRNRQPFQDRHEKRDEAAKSWILHDKERLVVVFAFDNISQSIAETPGFVRFIPLRIELPPVIPGGMC